MQSIWIVDFGSQYTQLIARKSRELGFKSIIMTLKQVKEKFSQNSLPQALILSGGPQSVFEDKEDYSFIFNHESLPILGICYGMQILGKHFGGVVEKGHIGEYGHASLHFEGQNFLSTPDEFSVWMSHSDHVSKVPNDFEVILKSKNDIVAAIKSKHRPILGLQFHPEVEHTEYGKDILEFFYTNLAGLKGDWEPKAMLEEADELVRSIGDKKVLCAFSGGVDSLVAAILTQRLIGDNLHCFFVDHGLLRPQDIGHIKTLQEKTPLNIEILKCDDQFLSKLDGVEDPEKKRKIIGNTFIDVFEQKVHEYEKNHDIHFEYLLQGTLYPDVIESISPHEEDGKSVTIKSHHNVGGLPERMKLELLEPFRFLFKDEVRKIGLELNLEKDWVFRHPFPGPGIGIRVLGELTADRIRKVQESDQILFEELKNSNEYDNCWQAFTVLLPVKTVGVKGDYRAYEEVICLRMVNSIDGMTATWTDFSHEFLSRVSRRVTNEVAGVTRVVYDITSKPPGTIEWE